MPYQIIRREWDLMPGEQEKAVWLQEWARRFAGQTPTADNLYPRMAFEHFKGQFYSGVYRRLDLAVGDELPGGYGEHCFNLSADCRKLLGWRVEKV